MNCSTTTRPTPPLSRRELCRCPLLGEWRWSPVWNARLDVHKILGLEEGDARVIRNAGGVITDDEIRSLTISQRLLGTREIILIHHTDCGMLTFSDEELKGQIHEEVGLRSLTSPWSSSLTLEEDVRQSIARIRHSPFIPHKEIVRGFIYEVETGRLREVS